jgi:hypothetical protein
VLQPNAPPARGADDTVYLPEVTYFQVNPKIRSKTHPASVRLLILTTMGQAIPRKLAGGTPGRTLYDSDIHLIVAPKHRPNFQRLESGYSP